MIIRTRRKNESLIGRLFGSAANGPGPASLFDEQQFQFELLKEIYRSDRRASDREFGLIRMIFQDQNEPHIELDDQVLEAFRNRLRVTDSVGCYDSSLAFLLPETDKEGALRVANSLAEIAMHANLSVDTEVSIYPWDDELIALSDELKRLANKTKSDDGGPGEDDPGADGSGDNHAGQISKSSNGSKPAAKGKTVQCERFDGDIVFARHPFVRSFPTPWWKRAVDITCSGTGLLILSPVFVAAAVAIKLNSPGPVFFRQMREGKNGQPFGILKFRTMDANAEEKQADLRERSEQDGPAFKLANDPRVTTVGKYLRKSCVDELPQLFNVLIGQMSLVGPRPLPIVESYACQAWQRARLTVLPGLTCIWQVRGGRDVRFSQWMRMDLEYIQRRGFWFDLKLIMETAFIALLHRGSV